MKKGAAAPFRRTLSILCGFLLPLLSARPFDRGSVPVFHPLPEHLVSIVIVVCETTKGFLGINAGVLFGCHACVGSLISASSLRGAILLDGSRPHGLGSILDCRSFGIGQPL